MALFPQINFPDIIQTPILPYDKKSPLWDFETGCFLQDESGKWTVTEDETLILAQLARLMLMTERGMYEIHDFNFGCDILSIIGYDKNYVLSRLSKLIKEALSTDNRFKDVQITVVSNVEENIILELRILTYRGQQIIQTVNVGAA